ncbi:MAG: efflux RND transporter permease subunit, partial [Acidobacteriaceae bacterium]|nr:efflux RND transporter permease subunit [Acidobacteriaceae bacterium]
MNSYDFEDQTINDRHQGGKGFNLSALAVREKAITLFLLITIAAAGIFAFLKLGRAEDPTFTIKVFTVSAVWPGATAQEMQDLVGEPLEKRMQELRDYDRVETFTRPGLALMMVTLKDNTPPKDVPEEFYQARKKLGDEAHNLPQGVFGPFINDEYSDVTFALYSVEAPGLPPRQLTREAETLRQRILHVPGVKKIDVVGERPERIFVEFSYQRLATLGVNARDIFDALVRENAVTPSGSIDTKAQQVYIRLDGAFDDLQKIRDTPIVGGGRTLKLSDVADVKRGYEDPATFLVRHNGQPALLLSIVMKEGWNGLDLGKALLAEQKKISADLPAGISFSKVTDQAVNIREAVGEFMLKFFVALAVVMMVSFFSLGFREGIVVAAAVPLTLAIVFVIMLLTGRVFDRITLGALILGLGLLVDDAIISIEIMVVKLEEGWNRIRAAGYAWSHTASPMLAGTLVTVIGLMPVGFARSTAGEYAGNIFWVVGFALLASWIVAV